MEARAINPDDFREGQRTQWNEAAIGWKKWSEWFDRQGAGVSDRLVELAGVGAGSKVIDIGAGYGEPTLTAAKVAGSDGNVVSTDPSTEMLAYGRERAAGAGLENIEFVQGNTFDLEFPEGTFDAAVSRWG